MNRLITHFLLLGALITSLIITGCTATSVSVANRPALHNAALLGDANQVQRLLASGANPNQTDESGFTAIHWAAANSIGNHRQLINDLVNAGANPNVKQGTAQMTPLQFAANAEAAQALIDRGARLDTRDISQSTPLHSATDADVAKVLLDNGADINATNISGHTPLQNLKNTMAYFDNTSAYSAIRQQYQKTIQLLERYQGSTLVNHSTSGSSATTLPSMTVSTASASAATTNLIEDEEEDQAEQQAKALEEKQVCPMYDYDWFYTGKDCKDELAHGQGEAINPYENLRFEGKIVDGKPTEGTLYHDQAVTYEGDFKDGLAHGAGLCFYQGAPEECRYYKGERIDSLHKQRQEFERQQQILSEQRQETERASDQYSSARESDYGVYQAPRYNTSYEQEQSDPVTDAVQDAVTEELIDQGAKMLLDQFF